MCAVLCIMCEYDMHVWACVWVCIINACLFVGVSVYFNICFYQQIARALQSLMDWDPEAGEDMESHFMLTFQVSTDMFGFVHTHNLKENGDTIPVTKDNRKVWLLCVGV